MTDFLLVDAHQDLAWNMLSFGRDYTLSAAETRKRELDTIAPQVNGDTLLGWPDYQLGKVGLIFSTLFARSKVLVAGTFFSSAATFIKSGYILVNS